MAPLWKVGGVVEQLDHDGDGYITARDLKEALDTCGIHIDQATMDRLVLQQGYGGSKGLISAAAFQVGPLGFIAMMCSM